MAQLMTLNPATFHHIRVEHGQPDDSPSRSLGQNPFRQANDKPPTQDFALNNSPNTIVPLPVCRVLVTTASTVLPIFPAA